MKPDITEIRKDREINLLIEKGNEVLRELGYTEHSRKHAAKAAETAGMILKELGYKKRTIVLAYARGDVFAPAVSRVREYILEQFEGELNHEV